jgi:2-polyprenyl-3-methyl-5-hydroxy-6-metoxy-1,4-benzoquinol methylase
MRTERINISTPEINQLENKWWNEHAELIEKIWAHSEPIQRAIRLHYLQQAKKFLQNPTGDAVIWEVGCGTGWVCRLIADKNFRIKGTDFSQGQIDIALRLAKATGKDAYCTYEVSDASTIVTGYNGIFIHALLHHLSTEELNGFFKIFDHVGKGTKVFMYEPVFIESRSDNGKSTAWIIKGISSVYKKFVNLLIGTFGTKDIELIAASDKMTADADKNGWFISPKEIPFKESEINGYLDRYFVVNKQYFVNSADFELAQNMMLYSMDKPGAFFKKILLPIATTLDRMFFNANFRSVTKGRYFFCCYELVRK